MAEQIGNHSNDIRIYNSLQPHQKKFWNVVESLLLAGVMPTPKLVNEKLGKAPRTNWNGPLCAIRTMLLERYGYEMGSNGKYQLKK